jgi:hypothetical protein
LLWYHRDGQSVDELLETFPTLNRMQVEQALAFCDANRDRVEEYVRWEEDGMARNRAARGKGITLDDLRRRLEQLRSRDAS